MFEDSYNEYIRSVLGYPNQVQSNIPNGIMEYEYTVPYQQNYSNLNNSNDELNKYYPEIYKIVYPMVMKVCNSNRGEVTKELLENLTDEIYYAIEDNNEINVNINLGNEIQNNSIQKRNENKPENKLENKNIKNNKELKEMRNDRSPRQMNTVLRDLIKILLLRELTGRPQYPNRPPNRPPFYGHPGYEPRPPFHGGPNRPPMRPRIYEEDYEDK